MLDTTTTALEGLRECLRRRGHERYTGEPVSHLEHALQTATLAQRAGAPEPLVVAALLHDIGHLLHGQAGTPSALGVDDAHEARARQVLALHFGPEVHEPVGLHVAAKRRLCQSDNYLRLLSEDSLRSLALQGGPMSLSEAAAFDRLPHGQVAVRLRVWDDAAKRPGLPTPDLDTFWALVQRCVVHR